MSLKKLMAEDPGIKAEVEALVREEKVKSCAEGKAEVEKRITAAAPFIGKTKYPEAISALAVGVVKGEKEPTALEGAVVAFDAIKQQQDSEKAAGENGEETPPDHKDDPENSDGTIANEEGYQAEIKKTKENRGDK